MFRWFYCIFPYQHGNGQPTTGTETNSWKEQQHIFISFELHKKWVLNPFLHFFLYFKTDLMTPILRNILTPPGLRISYSMDSPWVDDRESCFSPDMCFNYIRFSKSIWDRWCCRRVANRTPNRRWAVREHSVNNQSTISQQSVNNQSTISQQSGKVRVDSENTLR
jgi:hypothetical protein